jgi:hypothetical protein
MSRVSVTPRRYVDRPRDIRGGGPVRSPCEMRTLADWMDEHWDVWAMVAALTLAFIVSAGLGVAYNVTASRLQAPPTPSLESWPATPFDDGTGVHRTASTTA